MKKLKMVSASKVRQSMRKIVRDLTRGEIFVVTRHGKSVAMIVPAPQ